MIFYNVADPQNDDLDAALLQAIVKSQVLYTINVLFEFCCKSSNVYLDKEERRWVSGFESAV